MERYLFVTPIGFTYCPILRCVGISVCSDLTGFLEALRPFFRDLGLYSNFLVTK